jgi:hypothetical protein
VAGALVDEVVPNVEAGVVEITAGVEAVRMERTVCQMRYEIRVDTCIHAAICLISTNIRENKNCFQAVSCHELKNEKSLCKC